MTRSLLALLLWCGTASAQSGLDPLGKGQSDFERLVGGVPPPQPRENPFDLPSGRPSDPLSRPVPRSPDVAARVAEPSKGLADEETDFALDLLIALVAGSVTLLCIRLRATRIAEGPLEQNTTQSGTG